MLNSPANVPLRLDLTELRIGGMQILGDLHFSVKRGETLGILGPSGIGKTSLLRIIAGLETRFAGDLKAPVSLACIFQEPLLLPWRTALQNITLPTRCSDRTALDWLRDVGLGQQARHFPGHLSLGQQRRLALARAFAASPEVLLMDEPFVSLDPKLVDQMMRCFETLRARHNTTTVLVTHCQSEATRLCDRTLTLGGAPARIVTQSGLGVCDKVMPLRPTQTAAAGLGAQ